MMPDVSGFDVVRAVRENPATHDIPILVVTAKELAAEDKEALNGHIATILQKGTLARVDLLAWLDRLAGPTGHGGNRSGGPVHGAARSGEAARERTS